MKTVFARVVSEEFWEIDFSFSCSVRVIKSHRAGVGKSLKVRRLHDQRKEWKLPSRGYNGDLLVSIPLHCKVVDPSVVLRRLVEHSLEPHLIVPRIFHLDIAHEVCVPRW